MLKKLKT